MLERDELREMLPDLRGEIKGVKKNRCFNSVGVKKPPVPELLAENFVGKVFCYKIQFKCLTKQRGSPVAVRSFLPL